MTSAALLWASGRLLNTYTFVVLMAAGGRPFISTLGATAWGIPADAYAYATQTGQDGVYMVDVRTGETFLLAIPRDERAEV